MVACAQERLEKSEAEHIAMQSHVQDALVRMLRQQAPGHQQTTPGFGVRRGSHKGCPEHGFCVQRFRNIKATRCILW